MRIGIFGGTFDPVHLGHLIMAEQCREQGQLDQVWFVPSARPPHKQDFPITPLRQRIDMLQLRSPANLPSVLKTSRTRDPVPATRSILSTSCNGVIQATPGIYFSVPIPLSIFPSGMTRSELFSAPDCW